MPVMVDLPLVPATPIEVGAALNSSAEQFGAGDDGGADAAGRADVGDGVLDGAGGDDGLVRAGHARAVLRMQGHAVGFQPGELLRRPALVARRGPSPRSDGRAPARSSPAAASPSRRSRRRSRRRPGSSGLKQGSSQTASGSRKKCRGRRDARNRSGQDCAGADRPSGRYSRQHPRLPMTGRRWSKQGLTLARRGQGGGRRGGGGERALGLRRIAGPQGLIDAPAPAGARPRTSTRSFPRCWRCRTSSSPNTSGGRTVRAGHAVKAARD